MKMKKVALMLFLVFSATALYAQKLDQDLLNRFGESELTKIYNGRYEYYHYLMFEKTNGFEKIDKKALSKEQKKSAQELDITLAQLQAGEVYFFTQVNQELAKENYYRLSDGNYIIVFSKREMSKKYYAKYGHVKPSKPNLK